LSAKLSGGSSALGDLIGNYAKNRDWDAAKSSAQELYDNTANVMERSKEFLNNARFIGGALKNTAIPVAEKLKARVETLPTELEQQMASAKDTVTSAATNPLWWFKHFPDQAMRMGGALSRM
jgi:hypothetical protein